MVLLVPIAQGGYTMIDDEDAVIIGEWRWRLYANKYPGRGVRHGGRQGKQGVIYLHRAITGAGLGEEVDHINGDPRDNRRVNLRIVTRRQNVWNSSGDAGSASPYKGVSRLKDGRFGAQIRSTGKRWSLGVYDEEELAAAAYNGAAIILHGQYARLNPVTHAARQHVGIGVTRGVGVGTGVGAGVGVAGGGVGAGEPPTVNGTDSTPAF